LVSAAAVIALLAVGGWYNARLQEEVQRRAAKEVEAVEQQRRTKAQYQDAREAIHRMLDRLESKELAAVPQLLELRRRQLEDALAFYRERLREPGTVEAGVRFDAAVAYEQAAKVESLLGRDDTARELDHQAETLLRDLVVDEPPDSAYAAHLVSCLNHLGILRYAPAEFDQAESLFREAIRRCEAALEVDPQSQHWLYHLADSHRNLGNRICSRNRNEEAEHHYRAMAAVSERLVEAHPRDPRNRQMLAESHSRLGDRLKGSPQAAEAHFRQAEEQFLRVIQEQPQNRISEAGLGTVYNNWGGMWSEQGNPERALELFARGIARLEDVHRREPQYVQGRVTLQALHGSRAYLLGSQKRYADALPDWDWVVELEPDGPLRDFRRSERASVLAETGDHVAAMAEVNELEERKGIEARTLFNAACAAAASADKIGNDSRLPADDRARLAERYAAKAVHLLTRVRAARFFGPAEFVQQLQPPNFPVLQSRAEFQKLLKEAENQAGPDTAQN
jgi:tetratricopeptide (TPR) repeat protein